MRTLLIALTLLFVVGCKGTPIHTSWMSAEDLRDVPTQQLLWSYGALNHPQGWDTVPGNTDKIEAELVRRGVDPERGIDMVMGTLRAGARMNPDATVEIRDRGRGRYDVDIQSNR